MTHIIKWLTVRTLVLGGAFLSFNANAQVSASKLAVDLDNQPLTELEVGQTFRYIVLWNCSFTTTPPPNGCGDFELEDVLAEGLEFEGCAVTGDYSCGHDDATNTVTVDKLASSQPNGINLGAGESSEAIITVTLSSDIADFSDGTFPVNILNEAVIESDQGPVTASTNTDVNPPENNWTISKEALIPAAPLNPALDNNAIYRIEVCPDGPAGLGTGTIPLSNVIVADSCESGALFVGAELNGNILLPSAAPNDMCPDLEFDIGDIDPADGCQVVDVTLQYPSGTFAEGGLVNNTANAVGEDNGVEVGIGVCDDDPLDPCSNSVDQEIAPPSPSGNISKNNRRSISQLAIGALSEYNINFNLNDSNVVLSNATIEDTFPSNITVTNFRFNGWDDDSVLAEITVLGPPDQVISPIGYDGSSSINESIDPSATGFRIDFLTPLPPGFQSNGSIVLEYRVDSAPSTADSTFINCATLSADELDTPSENCATVLVVPPRADLQAIKDIPAALNPGEEFTATFSLEQDFTSSSGAANPTIVECLPQELVFVSWDTAVFPSGLDSPLDPVNLTNDRSLGVLPNIEVLAPGVAGNTCPTGGEMLRWSWSSTAPAGSLQLGNAAGVSNPFTFPIYPDRNGDNAATSADAPVGEFSRIDLGVTLQVVPGTPATPSGTSLSNTVVIQPENDNFSCITGQTQDSNDLDGDLNTIEAACQDVEEFDVLTAASIGAEKFVQGFPGLDDIDPANPPANADAANAGIEPAFCPDNGFGLTRAPCVAQGLAGQPFSYSIRLSNDGNVPLVDYVAYDILPYANDVGIIENQASTARGSTWTPELLGPVVLSSNNPIVQAELDRIGDLTIPDATRPRIEYSASTNPCRDELAIGLDGPWQGGNCDDDWTETPLADATVFPDGFGSVAAWRLSLRE